METAMHLFPVATPPLCGIGPGTDPYKLELQEAHPVGRFLAIAGVGAFNRRSDPRKEGAVTRRSRQFGSTFQRFPTRWLTSGTLRPALVRAIPPHTLSVTKERCEPFTGRKSRASEWRLRMPHWGVYLPHWWPARG